MYLFTKDGLIQLLLSLPIVLFALSAHEFMHAYVSWRLGDPTAKQAGRLTLSPWAHLDPIGTLMLVLLRFGWAKPVPIVPANYRNPAKGIFLVSLAGPATNFALALLFSLVLRFTEAFAPLPWYGTLFLINGVALNLSLFLFNLIPVPPLDGSGILLYFLRGRSLEVFRRLQPFGPLLLLVILMTDVHLIPLGFLLNLLIG